MNDDLEKVEKLLERIAVALELIASRVSDPIVYMPMSRPVTERDNRDTP